MKYYLSIQTKLFSFHAYNRLQFHAYNRSLPLSSEPNKNKVSKNYTNIYIQPNQPFKGISQLNQDKCFDPSFL